MPKPQKPAYQPQGRAPVSRDSGVPVNPAAPILEPASQPHDLPSELALSHNAAGDIILRYRDGHRIALPAAHISKTIHNLLTAMELASKQKADARIGTNAKPIQEMVERFMKTRELEKQNKEQEQFEELKELF